MKGKAPALVTVLVGCRELGSSRQALSPHNPVIVFPGETYPVAEMIVNLSSVGFLKRHFELLDELEELLKAR